MCIWLCLHIQYIQIFLKIANHQTNVKIGQCCEYKWVMSVNVYWETLAGNDHTDTSYPKEHN